MASLLSTECDKRLSTSLLTDFCEEAVREAINTYGWPEVFNTDQGCQYTSEQFTGIFTWEGCPTRLSMDGKGRAYDNIFVERFWRTLKQEDIYIRGYETVTECPPVGNLLYKMAARQLNIGHL